MSVREVTAPVGGRVETGAVRFGPDWPGLFVRGDQAFALALDVERLMKHFGALFEAEKLDAEEYLLKAALENLEELRSVIIEDVVQK